MTKRHVGSALAVRTPTDADNPATISWVEDYVAANAMGAAPVFTDTIGDGSSTSIAVTHNLNTESVVVQVREVSTDKVVLCDIVITDADTVTLGFRDAPSMDSVIVVIVGGAMTTSVQDGSVEYASLEPVLQNRVDAIGVQDYIAVAIGTGASAAATTVTEDGTSRTVFMVTVNSVGPRFRFINHHETATGNTDGAEDLVIGGCDVRVGGVAYRLTFNGSHSVTVKPGGWIENDDIALDLTAGTIIEARTYVTGTWRPNRYANGPGMGGWTATTNLTMSGTAIPDNTSFRYLIGPSVVYGIPATSGTVVPSVIGFGDSIMFSMHDGFSGAAGVNSTYDRGGRGGFGGRSALTNGYSFLNTGIGGQSAQVFATQIGHYRTMAFVRGCLTALEEFGRNDLFNGRTLAQLQADVILVWLLLSRRGLRIFRTTLVPDTTSTDGWRTTANQTVKAWETARVNFNNWLRDGAPMVAGAAVAAGTNIGTASRCNYYSSTGTLVTPASGPTHLLYGVCDTADAVESSRDSGKWRTPYATRTLSDGITTAAGSVVTSATAAATLANDYGKVVVIPGAGTAGALYVGTIKNVFSGTQLGVTPNTPTAIASGATVYILDAATPDGTHPGPAGHASMALALPHQDFI